MDRKLGEKASWTAYALRVILVDAIVDDLREVLLLRSPVQGER